LADTDAIMKRVFSFGVHLGLTEEIEEMREHRVQTILDLDGTVSRNRRKGLAVTSFPLRRRAHGAGWSRERLSTGRRSEWSASDVFVLLDGQGEELHPRLH
jgi:hypothetical protein